MTIFNFAGKTAPHKYLVYHQLNCKICCSWGTSGTRRVTAKRHELVLVINIEIPLTWR
jgi:hypothetical protein